MDTSTSYLGLRLPHPFVAGASPIGRTLDGLKRLEDAGFAAIVLPSLFEEQIGLARETRIAHMDATDPAFRDVLNLYPDPGSYAFTPDSYAEHIARARQATSIPIIASLNGSSAESWLSFARTLEQAGAHALELNLYWLSNDLQTQSSTVEDEWLRMIRAVKHTIAIPLSVKVTPFFTAFGYMARCMCEAGADGLVLFNRFYQADIDISSWETPALHVELSTSQELLLRLRWVAALHGRVRAALALTGGIETPNDGIKAILAGADVVQMVSAILRHGPTHLTAMRDGLERWLEWHTFNHLDDARGLASLQSTADTATVERTGYLRMLQSWA